MARLLHKPYPMVVDTRHRIRISLGSGLFIFLFLWTFLPFELWGYPGQRTLFIAGYGIITAAVSTFWSFVLPSVLPRWYQAERWTIRHEILNLLLLVCTVGFMNFLYTVYMGVTGFHWLNLLYFMGITFLVGLFPVTAVVVLKEFRLMKRNMAQAAMLTQALKDQHEIGIKPADQQAPLPTTISLRNETGAESLSLSANTLLFIAAADNYIEVCFEENGQAKKTLLRSSLKRAEEDLADFPGIMRCHRGYLVNTERIVSVSGNAQGLRLSLPPFPETIPVSRNYVARLRDLSGK